MAKNFSVFYGGWSFVTMFVKDCHYTISSASFIRSRTSMLCSFSIRIVLTSSNFESLFILQDSPARVIGLSQIIYLSRTKQPRKTRVPLLERNSDPHRRFERLKTVLIVWDSVAAVIDEVLNYYLKYFSRSPDLKFIFKIIINTMWPWKNYRDIKTHVGISWILRVSSYITFSLTSWMVGSWM
jgi:hypothetical protein